MTIRHLTRVAAAAAVAVGVCLTSTITPASAAVIDTDYPEIYDTNVQFGTIPSFWDLSQGLLQPGGPGNLDWDVSNGIVTPRLYGLMHTEDLAGTCAKMRLYYYAEGTNGGYEYLAQRSSPRHCPINDDYELTPVDIAPFSDPDIVRVLVATTVLNGNGRYLDNIVQAFNLD